MMVLDPALADMDGYDLIRVIRRQSLTPIIVLSTSDDERSKVRAFDLGVDDYVTKPFADQELLARLRTALRHRFQARGEQPRFVSGDLIVDLVRRKVQVRGRPVTLTRLEYKVLSVLVRHAGRVLTHRQLTREVWVRTHRTHCSHCGSSSADCAARSKQTLLSRHISSQRLGLVIDYPCTSEPPIR
jgi:two-component system, OmpR family, KDP operon response regulator KdpE